MDIRKATEQDIDAILALNWQISQLHFEQEGPVLRGRGAEHLGHLLEVELTYLPVQGQIRRTRLQKGPLRALVV
ncbi:hypothetical protein [Aeromonas caviae]|uniref:hypothetical protein n=1 Tax=Aeromonas caviae TaxID=648 RepID=UPI001CC538A8|nr:hypothetical protein KAM362_14020 [Aeromonas caviae]